ncbi:hypothetical protein MCOR27_005684 [Pyricularia oryzae]|uniref:Uncharacterized protein n=2 Tax=Pyricularia TaxID=48558 RepID=A0ABQ8NU44_PYRGI|nr:hypothetical protein MCOR19_005499 [Pyricularia oryzae]KAI6301628.1 hypothetical protein MCOR33_002905 [Pyricularia grisea]KAI6268022.1 hypothetical protein MCOR26_009409 [Pyricularia oryzae]KAI6278270.1 hypothetical protein MCOR27_005684 [Pyricularia oryzae]KAI6305398.1 hypothetical protein MCOR34_008598 [Pyricularia oryzae]
MVVGAFPPLAPRSKQQQTDTANSRITEIESPSQGQPWAPMANAAAHEADRSFRSSQARGDRPPGDFRVPDYSDDRRHGLSSSRPYRVDWGEMDGPIFDRQPRPLMGEEPLHSSDLALIPSPRRRHKTSSRTSHHHQPAMYSARPQEPHVPSLTRSSTAPHSQRRSFLEDEISRSDSRRSGSRRDQSPRSHPFQSVPGSPATSLTEPDSDSDGSTSSTGHYERRERRAGSRDALPGRYQPKRSQRRHLPHDDVIPEEEDDRRSGRVASHSRRRMQPVVESFSHGKDHYYTPHRNQRRTPEFDEEFGSSPDSRRGHYHPDQPHILQPQRPVYVTDGSDTGSSLSRNFRDNGPPQHCDKRIKPDDVHHTEDGHKYGICGRCRARICYMCGTPFKRCNCPPVPRRGEHGHLATERDEHPPESSSHQVKRSDIRDTEYCQQPIGVYSPPESPTFEKSTRSNLDSYGSPGSRDSRAYREREKLGSRVPVKDQDDEDLITSMHDRQGEDLKRRLRGSPCPEGTIAKYYADEASEAMKSPQSTALTHSRLGTMVPVAAPLPPQDHSNSEFYALAPAYSNNSSAQPVPPPAVPIAPPPNDYHDASPPRSNHRASMSPAFDSLPYPPKYSSSQPPAHLDEPMYAHSYPPVPVPPQVQVSPRCLQERQADPHWPYDSPRTRQREHSPNAPYSRSLPHTTSAVPPPVPMPPPAVPIAPSASARMSELPERHLVRAAQAPRAAPSPPPESERHSRSGDYVSSVNKARTRRSSVERRMADRFNPESRHSYDLTVPYAIASSAPLAVHPGPMLHGPVPAPSIVSLHHPSTPMHHHVPLASPAHQHPRTPPRSQHPPMYPYASPVVSVGMPLHPTPSIPMMTHMPMGPVPHPAISVAPGPPFASMPRRHTMDDEIFGSNNSRSTRSSDLGPAGGPGRRSRRHAQNGEKHAADGGESHSPSRSSSRRRQRQKSDSVSTPTTSRRHHQNEAPYLEDEQEKPSDSSLAGLSGSGRGMNRVYEWNKHVVMGSSPNSPAAPPSSVGS